MQPRPLLLSASLSAMLLLAGCGESGPELPSGHLAAKHLNALVDGSPLERERAARDLAQLKAEQQHPAIATALIEATEDHQDRVQIAAVRALGQLKEATALERLLELAGPQNADGVRQAACAALGQLGDESAIPMLITAREADALTVRVAATMALAQCGAVGEQALVSAWEKTADNDDKASILQALATTNKVDYFPLFSGALSLDHQTTVAAAAQAISTFDSAIAIPALVEGMEQGKLRSDKAIPLLLSLDQQQSVPVVVKMLEASSAAHVAIKHLKDLHAAALPALHSYFASEDAAAQGRLRALDLILDISEQAARGNEFSDVRVIHNAHRLPDKYDRLTIVLAEHPELMQQLTPRLEDSDVSVRFAIAKLFAWQGLPQGLPPLIALAHTEQDATNAAVWQAIAKYTTEARNNDSDSTALAKRLVPLLGKTHELIARKHDEELLAIANGGGSPQRDAARMRLQIQVSLQSNAIKIASALRSGQMDAGQTEHNIIDPIFSWAMRENWPKNPKNMRQLGASAREAIGAWNSPELRQQAWQAYQQEAGSNGLGVLGQLGVVEAIPDLIRSMENPSNSRQTISAMRSASQIAAGERGSNALRQQVSTAIAAVLRGTPPRRNMEKRRINDFAQAGIPALQKLADPRAVDTLIFLIKQPENPLFPLGYGNNTAELAAKALAQFQHQDGPSALVQLLAEENIDIAQKNSIIAPAIVQSAQPALIDALLSLMRDQPANENAQNFDPGFYAADILGTIGETALPRVIEIAGDNSITPLYAQRIARSLALVNDPAAIPPLTQFLNSSDNDVVIQALASLGQNKQDDSLIALRNFAEKSPENPDIRQMLTWAMAQHQ